MHPEEESPDLDDDLTFIKELILGRPLNGKVGAVFLRCVWVCMVAVYTHMHLLSDSESCTSLYIVVQEYKGRKKLFFYKVTLLPFIQLIPHIHYNIYNGLVC